HKKTSTTKRNNVSTRLNENVHTQTYVDKQKQTAIEVKKNAKIIFDIIIVFAVLLLLSYRYALINAKLSEKETLKTQLSNIQKQNAQLKVSIEQGMNINTIEQAAKEKLGMQKLDNNQKVYISLDKKDYTESSNTSANKTTDENWFQKLLELLKGE
ncbi:MAG TPA: hypothetical protein PKK61_02860, partial [Defluviitaleaceae bacterium]|nr:hypothetical protein [Defluviitaleaceae bacterium]